MRTLYVSKQGCYITLKKEIIIVKQGETICGEIQLPLLEQILIFGKSQISADAVRACLQRNVPIAYLSRMGYCYGRIMPIERGYRQLSRYQQQLTVSERLQVAREIVQAKLKNSRVFLMRQQRRKPSEIVSSAIKSLEYLAQRAALAESIAQLMGFEGAGAAQYFSAFGECITHPDFVFIARSRRPPGNPVNAMLSFGYQVLWNHLLSLIELQGLDPGKGAFFEALLGSEEFASTAGGIEEFVGFG